MKLPNGVTGIYNAEETPPPKVDRKQFKQLCFNIIIRNGGKILEFKEPEYPINFYSVHIKIFEKDFYILLNEHYLYLAFASSIELGNIQFIDIPLLCEQFNPFYDVLKAEELNFPVTFKNRPKKDFLQNDHALNSAELNEIRYWKPEIIGEIIFNYWD